MSITSFTTELPTFLDIANRLESAFAGYAETREALFKGFHGLQVAEANYKKDLPGAELNAWQAQRETGTKVIAGERDAYIANHVADATQHQRRRLENARADYEELRMRDDIAYQQLAVAKRMAELAIAAAHQP